MGSGPCLAIKQGFPRKAVFYMNSGGQGGVIQDPRGKWGEHSSRGASVCKSPEVWAGAGPVSKPWGKTPLATAEEAKGEGCLWEVRAEAGPGDQGRDCCLC